MMNTNPTAEHVAVPVAKTSWRSQAVRVAIAAILALASLLGWITSNQAQLAQLLPSAKWGAALFAIGMASRFLQEVLVLFNLHTVTGTPGTPPT